MTDNIVDLFKHRNKQDADEGQLLPIEKYSLGDRSMLMSVPLQLDVLLNTTVSEFISGDVDAGRIHKLLKIMQYLHDGIYLPFDVRSHVVVRENPDKKLMDRYTVYNWAMGLDKMTNHTTDSLTYSYQLEIGSITLNDPSHLEPSSIHPVEWMEFDINADDCITKRFPKHVISKMNSLVKNNAGRGFLNVEGGYMALLPYSDKFAIFIYFVLENPIKLILEGSRPPAK